MKIRVLASMAVVTMFVADAQARSPFGRSWNARRNVTRQAKPQQRPTAKQLAIRQILQNPEEMTKRFGPSILIREESIKVENERFVTQPK